MGDRYFVQEKHVDVPMLGPALVYVVVCRADGKEVGVGSACKTRSAANLWAMALDAAYEEGLQAGIEAERAERE